MIIEAMSEVCSSLSERVGYRVNYLFGDSSYIREELLVLGKSQLTASGKFPLIGLFVPFDEVRDSEDYFCKASVNLIIATNTLAKYTNEQRREISFEGVLRPLYRGLMDELRLCGKFDFGYAGIVSHVYSENYSFGRRGALDVDGKEVGEKIDAIEIKNLELTVKNQNCYANRY